MNQVNSRNDFDHEEQHNKHCRGYYYYYNELTFC